MRTLFSNNTNDIVLDADGNIAVVSDINAIGSTTRQYMQTRRGEMIHDIQSGIPFQDVVWSSAVNVAQFEAAGRARLLQVPDVTEVTAFSAVQDGELLSYTATIQTTAGETTING